MNKKHTFNALLQRLQVLVLFIVVSFKLPAQWQAMNGPITSFARYPSDANTLFAGDMYGLIRKSTDKGVTWTEATRAGYPITDIAFVDDNKGFAATDQPGLILITTDGGTTWKRKKIIDPQRPHEAYRFHPIKRIVVLDANTIFFDVYNHPISSPSSPETIVTRDGGATFDVAYAPGNLFRAQGDTLLAFGKQTDFFGIAYFTIFKSVDKGISWSTFQHRPTGLGSALNGNGIHSAFFLSAKEYFITANLTLGSDGQLYKTVDGGKSFAATPKPSGYLNTKVEWMHFKDAQNGVIIFRGGGTFFTTNGGTSWTQGTNHVGRFPGIFLGNQTLLANLNGRSTISTDYGATWTSQSDPLNSAEGQGGSFFFMQLANKEVAYASIGGYNNIIGLYGTNLVKTNNGGITWQNVTNSSNTVLKGESFGVIGPDTFLTFESSGFAMKRIVLTKNNGKTVETVAENINVSDLNEIGKFKFIDKKNIIAYAVKGAPNFWWSADTGRTWTKLPQVTSQVVPANLVEISFPSLHAWYILVDGGQKIFKSTDQGTSWMEVTRGINLTCGTNNAGRGIYFVNDTIGYVYGCGGRIFKTTNGAVSWASIRDSVATNIQHNTFSAMAFRTPTEGYILGGSPSENNGITTDLTHWNVSSGVPAGTKLIGFTNPSTGAALHSSGLYYSYRGPITMTTDTLSANVLVALEDENLSPSQNSVSLYPNPTESNVRIMGKEGEEYTFTISDLQGSILQRGTVGNQEVVAVSHLPKGLYLVTLHGPHHIASEKLMIK